MTYGRVVNRNRLHGDYGNAGRPAPENPAPDGSLLAGDLRRLEADAVDGGFVALHISQETGVPVDHVIAVLRAFFALRAGQISCPTTRRTSARSRPSTRVRRMAAAYTAHGPKPKR